MDSVSFKDGNLSAKLVPSGVLKGSMSVSEYCHDYDGSYTAAPTNENQVFYTKDKRMSDNFTVGPIPFDLSSDTITSEELLYSVTAHDKDGNPIVGTMPDNGAIEGIIESKDEVYSIPYGYHNGGTIQIASEEQDKIIPNNIREGVTVLGVTGNVTGSDGSADVLDSLITRDFTEISNSRVTSIGNHAFYYCSSLTTADIPLVTSIGSYAFYYCSSLTTVDFPLATSIGNYAFYYCSSLATVDFPLATRIGNYAFQYCFELTTADFPLVTNIGTSAFYGCSSLTTVDFPLARSIGMTSFRSCSSLTALILHKSDVVCALTNANAFTSTPIASGSGYIYVPSALIDNYKVATNWSTYANQIRAIEDYPEITGG